MNKHNKSNKQSKNNTTFYYNGFNSAENQIKINRTVKLSPRQTKSVYERINRFADSWIAKSPLDDKQWKEMLDEGKQMEQQVKAVPNAFHLTVDLIVATMNYIEELNKNIKKLHEKSIEKVI